MVHDVCYAGVEEAQRVHGRTRVRAELRHGAVAGGGHRGARPGLR